MTGVCSCRKSFGSKGIPPLCSNIERIAPLGNDLSTRFGLGHVAYHTDLLIQHQLVIILLGDGGRVLT